MDNEENNKENNKEKDIYKYWYRNLSRLYLSFLPIYEVYPWFSKEAKEVIQLEYNPTLKSLETRRMFDNKEYATEFVDLLDLDITDIPFNLLPPR